MFDFGFSELVVCGIVGLVVLGPERLPVVAKTAGQWIGKAQRFVQQQHVRILEQLPGNDQPLALAARHGAAPDSHLSVKAARLLHNIVIDARKLGRLGQLLVAHRTAHTVGHALPDCAAEGGCVLGHIGDFVPPGTQVQLVQILASHGNGPLIRAVQPLQQT